MLVRKTKLFIVILLMTGFVSANNYPEDGNKKCYFKKLSLDFTGALCIPQENGWTEESENTCKVAFKNTCPEFNIAECLWYSWTPSDPSVGVKQLQIPCCRLKYYAAREWNRKYTWMEIFYTNQYGTSNKSIYDVIEIHRLIKNHEVFGENDQPDWPGNVVDPKGERGLPWKELKNNTNPLRLNGSIICPNNKDEKEVCSVKVIEYLLKNFKKGFDPNLPVIDGSFNPDYAHDPSCSYAMIGEKKTDVCKVVYYMKKEFYWGKKRTNIQKRIYTDMFMEAHISNDPQSGDALIRYAYLPA